MINYQTITIDLQPDYREPVVQMYLSERDVGRPIQVNVLMQGQPYSFIAGTTVHIDLRKPSGHVVQVNGNYAVGSNVVLFNVVEQMAAEPGMCLTELSIVGDGQDPIGSKNWLTKVELSPMHAGDPSETWIEDLDELVQDAMEGHIDATLSIEGDAADAKAAGDAIAAAVEQIPAVDDTLSIPGDAADAAAVGEELANLSSAIEQIEPGLSDDAKVALLACFEHVAWATEQGEQYVAALRAALYVSEYPKITAQYVGTGVLYTDSSSDEIKRALLVTYYADEESEGTAIPSSDYSVSGALNVGTSVLTVSYSGKEASVSVPVVDFYNIAEWSTTDLLQAKLVIIPGLYQGHLGYGQGGNSRGSIWAKHGVKSAYNNITSEFDSTVYPIPIPENATSMTITCTNYADIYAAVSQWKYYASANEYTRKVNGGWVSIVNTFPVDRSASDFITINLKNGSAGTAVFTAEPIISVVFE